MTQPLQRSLSELARTSLSEVAWPAANDDHERSFIRGLPSPPNDAAAAQPEFHDELVELEGLVIDVAGREVTYRSRIVELTHLEFDLLLFFVRNRGRVFTREQLVERLWSESYLTSHRTVDIHVHRLRAKLGAPWDRFIATVRRVGYKLAVRPRFTELPEQA